MLDWVHERGPTEIVTKEAFQELEEAIKRGEIAAVAQAHSFLSHRGVRCAHSESGGGLLRRKQVKLKTGWPATRRPTSKSRRPSKKFTEKVSIGSEERNYGSGKALKVLAFDEVRCGLIDWHRRRYCPKAFRPPWVRRAYE